MNEMQGNALKGLGIGLLIAIVGVLKLWFAWKSGDIETGSFSPDKAGRTSNPIKFWFIFVFWAIFTGFAVCLMIASILLYFGVIK
jgi:hypothetical protein